MFEAMTDEQFRRHVILVCHTMAYRKYQRDHPAACRAEAWEFAINNWQDYQERAITFLAAQELHREDCCKRRSRSAAPVGGTAADQEV